MGGFERDGGNVRNRNGSPPVISKGPEILASEAPDAIVVQSPLNPRQMGYTGNICTNCNSSRMQVAGHCEVCLDCGTTTGCS